MTATSGRDEGQRQAYLAALAIPLWTARYDLPGAAPSLPLVAVPFLADVPEAAFPEEGMAEPEAPAADLSEPVARQAPVVAPPSAVPAMGQAVRQAATPVAPATGMAIQGTPALPRFTLRVQPLAPGWLAIIALGDVPDLSGQEYRLLSAISHALGAAPDFSGSASLLRWPLNANPKLDHGPGAAVEWLSHALKVPDGWRCLVLGEAVAVHVRAALPASTTMVAGPALATLLTTPQAKKSFWLSLNV